MQVWGLIFSLELGSCSQIGSKAGRAQTSPDPRWLLRLQSAMLSYPLMTQSYHGTSPTHEKWGKWDAQAHRV